MRRRRARTRVGKATGPTSHIWGCAGFSFYIGMWQMDCQKNIFTKFENRVAIFLNLGIMSPV
jgi:hypothetical protein